MQKIKNALNAAKPVWPILVGVALISGSTGALVAHEVTKKRLIDEFNEELRRELDIQRTLAKVPPIKELSEKEKQLEPTADAAEQIVDEYLGEVIVVDDDEEEGLPEPSPERKVYNLAADRSDAPLRSVEEERAAVFIQPHDGGLFKYDDEIPNRSEDEPYVISEDEYIYQEKGYETACLTYYKLDDSLCDDKEILVDNVDMLIGTENLKRFGHGSTNEDVVFVRNDGIGMEFEIEQVNRSYKSFVMGFEEDE